MKLDTLAAGEARAVRSGRQISIFSPSRATSVSRPRGVGLGGDVVHEIVVWSGRDGTGRAAHARGIGELDALLPARMAPTGMRGQFLGGIGRVEDQERHVLDQRGQRRVGCAGADFDVGDVGDRTRPP